MQRVLIAHQSTIPHYRVPFYNALEQRRPAAWSFDVVFDPTEISEKNFFSEPVDPSTFNFSTLPVKTILFRSGSKKISYQTFLRKAAQYDLIVVENAVNNLSYPLSHVYRLWGKKIAYWGHGKNRTVEQLSLLNRLAEHIKLSAVRHADGFFAYTDGVKSYLVEQGIPPAKVFVLNNTIDILQQRSYYQRFVEQRRQIRRQMGIDQKKALLFVGRITKRKRIDFLIDAFKILLTYDPNYHLILVGGGDQVDTQGLDSHLTQYGPLTDLEQLSPLYLASDIYVLPGVVGLGPLQGLCYDLPAVIIDSPIHNPEIEYLTPENSVMLDLTTHPTAYALAIHQLFLDQPRLARLRSQTWSSISHLTIENMADRFINGVNHLLG